MRYYTLAAAALAGVLLNAVLYTCLGRRLDRLCRHTSGVGRHGGRRVGV